MLCHIGAQTPELGKVEKWRQRLPLAARHPSGLQLQAMSLEEESEEDAIRKAELAWQEFDQQRRDRRLARIAELEQRIGQHAARRSLQKSDIS